MVSERRPLPGQQASSSARRGSDSAGELLHVDECMSLAPAGNGFTHTGVGTGWNKEVSRGNTNPDGRCSSARPRRGSCFCEDRMIREHTGGEVGT